MSHSALAEDAQLFRPNVKGSNYMAEVKTSRNVGMRDQLPLSDMFASYVIQDDEAGAYGNLVEIYDLVPRFCNWQKKAVLEDGICTNFIGQVKGHHYHVTMTAAAINKRIKLTRKAANKDRMDDDKEEVIPTRRTATETVFIYPGVREELVEDALRKFSVSGYGLVDGSQLKVQFTIRDLMQELASNGHTYSCNEIKEALNILNKAHLSIKTAATDGQGATEVSSTYLPYLHFAHKRNVVENSDVCVAQLHPLIVRSVRGSTFRLFGYRVSMELGSSLARSIHKHLSFYWLNASAHHPYSLGLVETMKATSRGLQERMNDNTRMMEKALQELVDNKVLSHVEKTVRRVPKSKKIDDVMYKLFPTNEYVSTIIKSNQMFKRLDAVSHREALLNRGSLRRRSTDL
jgi:hypothetical protein